MKPPVDAADVEADAVGGIEAELRQRMGKLQPAARHPGVILPAHLKSGGLGDELSGLMDAQRAGKHLSSQDECLGAGAALDQT